MSREHQMPPDFMEWIVRSLDGTVTPEQFAQLDHEIATNDQARAYYLEFITTYVGLMALMGGSRSRDAGKKISLRRNFGLARSWVSRYILVYGRQGCHDTAVGFADRSASLPGLCPGANQWPTPTGDPATA